MDASSPNGGQNLGKAKGTLRPAVLGACCLAQYPTICGIAPHIILLPLPIRPGRIYWLLRRTNRERLYEYRKQLTLFAHQGHAARKLGTFSGGSDDEPMRVR